MNNLYDLIYFYLYYLFTIPIYILDYNYYLFFQIRGDTLDIIYYDRMSSMLAYFIDLKLMSSQ